MATCKATRKGIQLVLSEGEVDVIRFLGRELTRLLENGDPDQGILKPFFPSLQRKDDPMAVSNDLDEAMDADLMRHRIERIQEVEEELLADCKEGALDTVLSDERLDCWLSFLTDLRLLVSTVIGISDEDPDPLDADPDEWTMEEKIYVFLSSLQEGMLGVVLAACRTEV